MVSKCDIKKIENESQKKGYIMKGNLPNASDYIIKILEPEMKRKKRRLPDATIEKDNDEKPLEIKLSSGNYFIKFKKHKGSDKFDVEWNITKIKPVPYVFISIGQYNEKIPREYIRFFVLSVLMYKG